MPGGARADIERKYQPRQRLDAPESLIMPGLVNAHTHLAMSLFRGIADDLRLQDWLEKYIFPAEAKSVNPEFVRWGTRLGCLEMALSGTTTLADMYYYEDVVAEAVKEAGLRGVLGETIFKFPGPDAKTPAEALAFNERFIQRFRSDPLAVPALQALEMATILGARTLGMEKEIGSLEPAKRADMITVRLDAPHAVPLYNVYSQLVYALKGSDVEHVMVNGRLIVRSRRMLTLNQARVLAEAGKYRQKVQASLSK